MITYGKTTLLLADDEHIFAYTREYGQQKLLVVVNFFETPQVVDLPFDVQSIILQNYAEVKQSTKQLTLRPYEAIVYVVQ